jgi:hypothetical protein
MLHIVVVLMGQSCYPAASGQQIALLLILVINDVLHVMIMMHMTLPVPGKIVMVNVALTVSDRQAFCAPTSTEHRTE